jgi:hypothetical protein
MRKISFFTWKPASRAFWLSIALVTSFNAWGQQAQGGDSSAILAQLATAFSGGQVIQQVQISGNATWYSGTLEDNGSISLTALNDGSSQMQLVLASAGVRTESQTVAGSSSVCQWTGNDGVKHVVDESNCWKPAIWFLPALSLQPSSMASYIQTVDLGNGQLGFGTDFSRHLQCQLFFSDLPPSMAADAAQQSLSDLGLDPATMLPLMLAYNVFPDGGGPTPIAIEIHYSDYRTVNGVQLPFLIQRYVNGSLQLGIVVTSAQIN